MPKITLFPYRIRVVRHHAREFTTLDEEIGGYDVFDIVRDAFSNLASDPDIDLEAQRSLTAEIVHQEDDLVSGWIQTGDYGYESTLVNVETGETVHERETVEAELIPFFFRAWVPDFGDMGMLLIEKFGNLGAVGALRAYLREYMESIDSDFRIDLNPVVDSTIINSILSNGRLAKMRFIRHEFPSDIADSELIGGSDPIEYNAEVVISAKRNRSIPGIPVLRRFLERYNPHDVPQLIEITGFEYQSVKAEVVGSDNVRRTIDIARQDKFQAFYETEGEIQIEPSGHPNFDSINEFALGIEQELLNMDDSDQA